MCSPDFSSNSGMGTKCRAASSMAATTSGGMMTPPRTVTVPIVLITGRTPSRVYISGEESNLWVERILSRSSRKYSHGNQVPKNRCNACHTLRNCRRPVECSFMAEPPYSSTCECKGLSSAGDYPGNTTVASTALTACISNHAATAPV